MRVVPAAMTTVWKSGVYTGDNTPMPRVTIQRTQIKTRNYLRERYATYVFGNPSAIHELPNVKSVKWVRSIDSDAGTCEVVLYNTKELPLGTAPDPDDVSYNQPGFFTFNRGDDPNRWNHVGNGWTHRLYPDMLIRTYEGYGFDPSVGPELDPHMMPSGVWLIDDVELGADAMITLKCRDASRLLLDQIAFPPVVPSSLYPLKFAHFHTVDKPDVPVPAGTHVWTNPFYDTDSSAVFGGPNKNIGGHRASDAFNTEPDAYWLSLGHSSPGSSDAFEWVQAHMAPHRVGAVRVHVKGGPYRVYVSLHTTDNGWVGHAKIPYEPGDDGDNGSAIRFLKAATIDEGDDEVIDVRDTDHVDKIRITVHHLWDSNYGSSKQFRAAIFDVDVMVIGNSENTTWVDGGTKIVGNYDDYTDIVKFLLGYAGFLWPTDAELAFFMTTTGRVNAVPPHPDHVLWGLNETQYDNRVADPGRKQIGEIWGDMEQSGTYGPADLTTDIFDKKPLMDGVAYIRDMLGFIFYIDETGAAIFRSPNIWKLGNNVIHSGHRLTSSATYDTNVNHMVSIDESQTLMALTATLSGRNIRERIVVANIAGNVGAVTDGFAPYKLPPAGLRRVAIWSDQHFATRKECRIMADLISVRQLFTYRTDTVTIPGYPAIQIDDQVRLTERVTEEVADVHYIKGITSTLDRESGEWTYALDTHWLGTDPFVKWAFDPSTLSDDAQVYLRALGKIT